jgi:uncharacterized protein YfdQ (DUF2303 family)
MINKEAIDALTKAEAITSAGKRIEDAFENEQPAIALPNDFALHDLEAYAAGRRRARGTMTTSVLRDFAAYASEQNEHGAVFVDPDTMSATAVLNLGDPSEPGHADNLAVLKLRQTAPFAALLKKSEASGGPLKQADLAEFLEDWAPYIQCSNDEGDIELRKAVAAVRRITIENLRKVDSTVQQLAESRSAFESVAATSVDPIPTFLNFTTVPYLGLAERSIRVRIGVLTGNDKPTLNLRIINLDHHKEQMAAELAQLVQDEFTDGLPVHIGTYKRSA